MNILSLDLGTKTGYAILRNGAIHCGMEKFQQRSKEHVGARWAAYRQWLHSVLENNQVTLLAYEDVKRHMGVYAAHAYGGFLAMTEMVAAQHNVQLLPAGVTQVKRFWTGKGNATKELMMAECARRGFHVTDDNASDALAILHYAMEKV